MKKRELLKEISKNIDKLPQHIIYVEGVENKGENKKQKTHFSEKHQTSKHLFRFSGLKNY